MKLTVIGPWGGYPKLNAASSGYLLEHNGFHLLIDCGSGIVSKLPNILQPEELDAVIISHYHPDHIADIGVLQHARLIQGYLGKKVPSLPIYGHSLDNYEFAKLTYKEITSGIAYNPEETLAVGPFHVSFLKTEHPVPCFAMRIEAANKVLVYTADSAFKEEFIEFASGADLLLCECNFYGNQNGQSAGHMNSIEAGRFAQQSQVKQVVLTHLPHYGNVDQLVSEAAAEFSGRITLAKELETIKL
ncbi:MBL fold metallo-hydrolase [Bacillus rubiinfantis]|uniref:MBL fold metallo-hydrolase n=1 Tax=Bacillus rubiinfantis TaxID=1499680 RepID=UPI0005A852F0|nr:MBL fold metallo-hydrolase [Bacillus rubiinfantis]